MRVWFTHAYLCCHPAEETITDKYCTTKVRPQNNDFHFSNTPKSCLTYSSRKINTPRHFKAKINNFNTEYSNSHFRDSGLCRAVNISQMKVTLL